VAGGAEFVPGNAQSSVPSWEDPAAGADAAFGTKHQDLGRNFRI